jgi:hypothetical protein
MFSYEVLAAIIHIALIDFILSYAVIFGFSLILVSASHNNRIRIIAYSCVYIIIAKLIFIAGAQVFLSVIGVM